MFSLEKESGRQAMKSATEFRKGLLCSICNEFLRDAYNLPCGHSFCRECINDALAERNSCPDCMNPAWQKDTLKVALTDSTVQDWVANCERLYQAHAARQAKRDSEGSDTDTDSAFGGASSGDDDQGGTDVEEEKEEVAEDVPPIPIPSTSPQQQPNVQQTPKAEGNTTVAADRARKGVEKENVAARPWRAAPSTCSAAPGVIGVVCPSALTSSPSGENKTPRVRFQAPPPPPPLPPHACRSEAALENENEFRLEDPKASPRGKKLPPAIAVKRSDTSSSEVKDPVKSRDVHDDPRVATHEAEKWSLPGLPRFEHSADNSGIPGKELAFLYGTPPGGTPEKDAAPQPSSVVPQEAGADENQEATPSFAVELPDTCDIFEAEPSSPHSLLATTTNMLIHTPPTLMVTHTETAAAAAGCAVVLRSSGVRDVDAEGAAVADPARVRPGIGAEGRVERREAHSGTSDGASGTGSREKDAQATLSMLGETPDVGRQSSSPGRPAMELSPRAPPYPSETSSYNAIDGERNTHVGVGRKAFGGEDQRGGVEGIPGQSDSCDGGAGTSLECQGSQRVIPGHGGTRDVDHAYTDAGAVSGVSGSEDEVSDSESLPLLGTDEWQQGVDRRQQQQAGPERTPPSRGMRSPCAKSSSGVGGGDCSDGPDEGAERFFRHTSAEGNEEDGEETCDEADSLFHGDEVGAGLDVREGGGPVTTGAGALEDERVEKATSRETLEPKGGELALLGSTRAGPSSFPLPIPPLDRSGDEIPQPTATNGATSGTAKNASRAKEKPCAAFVRHASQPPAFSTGGDEHHRNEPSLAAAPPSGGEATSAKPEDCHLLLSGSSQHQSRSFALWGGVDHDDVIVQDAERGVNRGGLCVAETLPQTLGPDAEVLKESEMAVSLAVYGDTGVPETSVQSCGASDMVEGNAVESLAGGVRDRYDPRETKNSGQPTPMEDQPRRSKDESSEGRVESARASRLQVPDSCLVHADVREERQRHDGVAAPEQLSRKELGSRGFGDKNTQETSVGAPHKHNAKGGHTTASSQAAPLYQGAEQNATTYMHRDSHYRDGPQWKIPTDEGEKSSSGLEMGGSPEGLLGRDDDEVPETLQSQRTRRDVGGGKESSTPALSICLATKEISEQNELSERPLDAEGVTVEKGRQGEALRQVTENAAQNTTIQEIQSLTTQEVPETAYAWGSVGACESSSTGIDGGASAVMVNGSCPLSDALEKQQSKGTATQSTADFAEVGADGECDGEQEQDAAPATGAVAQQRQSQSGSPSSSAFPAEADTGGADTELRGFKEQDGQRDIERPAGRDVSPALVRTSATRIHGIIRDGVTSEGVVATETGTCGDTGKRSADSATLSPRRLSSDPSIARKALRLTPPSTASVKFSVRYRSAAGDVGPSSNGPPDCDNTRPEAGRSQQGFPIALRGGNGFGESGDESELPETDHDLAAVQDAWNAEGGYEFGEDGGYFDQADETETSRPPSPAADVNSSGKSRTNKVVANPYEPQAHLDLHPDGDDFQLAGTDGMMSPPAAQESEGSSVKSRRSRPATRRPSKRMMSFSARSPPSLTDLSLGDRMSERYRHQSLNKILGAGRVRSDKTPSTIVSMDKTGSWSLCDTGPNTEEVDHLVARVADRQAQQKPAAATASETNPFDPSDLDDDSDDNHDGDCGWVEQGDKRGGRQGGDARRKSSPQKKRKRTSMAATAPTTRTAANKGKAPSRAAKPNRAVSIDTVDEGGRRRHPVVVVLLGGTPREMTLAKELCARLGQRRPETELVSDATHVVVGSRFTRAANSSRSSSSSSSNSRGGGSGGGGASCVVGHGQGTRRRHELVRHGIKGYREAVMLGLWVLDFSWVEECSQLAGEGAGNVSGSGKRKHEDVQGVPILSSLKPPRDFELLGCSESHEGCEPRRGRFKRGSNVPGVFHGMVFCLVTGGVGRSPAELENSRLEAKRLLKLGGGVVLASTPSRVEEGFCDDPFGLDAVSVPHNEGVRIDAGSGSFGSGNAAAAAKQKKVVVLALPDCSDGRGISPSLAKVAIGKSKELGAVAAVERAWAVRSVEHGYPVPFDEHILSDGRRRNNGRDASKSSVSRLSIPHHRSSRKREVLFDVEPDGVRGMASAEAVRADRENTARLLQIAEEVAKVPARKHLPVLDPPGLGVEGFDFTRKGSEKSTRKANLPSNVTTYTAENKAQRDLKDALDNAGYLDFNSSEPDEEHRLGEFWFDLVYDGFFMKRSENAIPEAKRRGCPLDILRAEFDRHEHIQTDRARVNIKELPGEYPLWKAGIGADDAVEVL